MMLVGVVAAQTTPAQKAPAAPEARAANDISGMYSFLRDGEFLQLAVEKDGVVSGVISRYGDEASDKGSFLNQFIKKGQLKDGKLAFTSDTVHAVWWEFAGEVMRGAAPSSADEGYWLLRGKLVRHETQQDKSDRARNFDVELKSFPAEMGE